MIRDIEQEKRVINRQFSCHEMSGKAVVTRKPHKCYVGNNVIEPNSTAFRAVVYPDNHYGIDVKKPTAYYFCGHCGPCTH